MRAKDFSRPSFHRCGTVFPATAGDVWGDAELISIYQYLRRGARIPDSWDAAIAKFDNELSSHGLL